METSRIYTFGIIIIIFQKNTLCTYRKWFAFLPKVRHFFARRRSCFIFGSDDPLLPPARAPVCTGKKRKKSIFCYSYVTDSSLRSSSLQMFFKVGVLKMFVFFTTKRPVLESPFLVKLQAWGPVKNSRFYRTPLVAASVLYKNVSAFFFQTSISKTMSDLKGRGCILTL